MKYDMQGNLEQRKYWGKVLKYLKNNWIFHYLPILAALSSQEKLPKGKFFITHQLKNTENTEKIHIFFYFMETFP